MNRIVRVRHVNGSKLKWWEVFLLSWISLTEFRGTEMVGTYKMLGSTMYVYTLRYNSRDAYTNEKGVYN